MDKNYKSEYHGKIEELIAAGKSRTEIAEYFGVKPDTITHKLNAMKKAGEIGAIDFRSLRPKREKRKAAPVYRYPKAGQPKKKVDLSGKGIGVTYHTCPECRKTYPQYGHRWAYYIQKGGTRKEYCSWGCQRTAERKSEDRKMQKKDVC